VRSAGPVIGTVLTLLTMALSGCAGSNDSSSARGVVVPSAAPAEFDATTGGIEGQVVDDQFLPIVGATVGILQLSVTTQTDAAGRFSFSKIEPGAYDLAAGLVGYDSYLTKVTVVAGEVRRVDITLVPLAITEPYQILQHQRGLFGCGASWRPAVAVSGIAACGLLSLLGDLNTYDKFLLVWNLGNSTAQGWNASVFEMQWNTNQAVGKGLNMIWEVNGCSNVGSARFSSVQGRSPLKGVADDGIVDRITKGTTCSGSTNRCNVDKCDIQSRVFSSPDSVGSSYPADIGFTFQQQFDQYHTAFFHSPPPDDYTALAE
jgi:hypothetical protein